jgi:alpha-N-arabinofuranosidase
MASYAPLLVNINPGASQWGTNLIGYNAGSSYASPSYYAQAMFAAHIGDGTPHSALTGAGKRFYYSATVSSDTHVLHLKLVNASSQRQPLAIVIDGRKGSRSAAMVSLHAASYEATNTITDPKFIQPVSSNVMVSPGTWQHSVPPLTIEVIDVPLQ